jgi:hypothetical protein
MPRSAGRPGPQRVDRTTRARCFGPLRAGDVPRSAPSSKLKIGIHFHLRIVAAQFLSEFVKFVSTLA